MSSNNNTQQALQYLPDIRFERISRSKPVYVLQDNSFMPINTLLEQNLSRTQIRNIGTHLVSQYPLYSSPSSLPKVSDNKIHTLIESVWEGTAVGDKRKSYPIAKKTYYLYNYKTKEMTAPDIPTLKNWCKNYTQHIAQTFPLSNNSQTQAYIDTCTITTRNSGPSVCTNLVGEYIHALIDNEYIRRFPENTHFYHYTDPLPSTNQLNIAYNAVRNWWSKINVSSQKYPSPTINAKDRISSSVTIIRAIREMYKHQLPLSTIPLYAPQLNKKHRSFRYIDIRSTPSTNLVRKTESHLTELINSIPASSNVDPFFTDTGLLDDDFLFYNTKKQFSPDFLFSVAPPDTNKDAYFYLGNLRRPQNNDNIKDILYLNNLSFPSLPRMTAVEITSHRGLPIRTAPLTSDFLWDKINAKISQISTKYKNWWFNGSLFTFHILFPFDYAIIAQLDFNHFASNYPNLAHNLPHWYNNYTQNNS